MARVARSANTVSVACKLPQGIVLHPPGHAPIKLHGSASPYAIAGHGLTAGVPADAWEAAEKHYGDKAFFKNGIVFAHSRPNSVTAEAKERAAVPVGFEPIDPNRLPSGIQAAPLGE